MLSLVAHELCWIKGATDDPDDQCAHGKVAFSIDRVPLIKPQDGEWTVSTAALYLLRTLTADHTPEHPVAEGNFLFPCCGFNAWLCGERYSVMCMGCNEGIDTWIRHKGSMVHISMGESLYSVSRAEWHAAVLGFAKQIEDFYALSSPKVKPREQEDREGWDALWMEWRERIINGNQDGT